MSDNWKDVKNSNKKNKNIKEEEHILSNILFNGGCMRCINKSCSINEQHGICFPEKLSTFVQNPTYINGVEKAIQNAKLDFNGKKPFFTTCNYTNKRCRNCEEGRIKYVDFNDQKIALCYPSLEVIKFKVTVGLHIDIKLILKGTKYEVSAIPINIENKKIEHYNPDIKELDNDFEENWPDLCNNTNKNECKSELQNKNVLDFSNFEKSNKQIEKCNLDTNTNINKKESIKEKNIVKSNDKVLKENIDDSLLIEKDNQIKDLLYEISYLKQDLKNLYDKYTYLEDENKYLEEKNKREMFIIDNQHKYDEILENVKYLNTRITQQFFETNYEQYVLI
jgi:hypothetical protein